EEGRRRGVDLASGVAFGLGLPGSEARLVSRDDGGAAEGLDVAMAELASDGASIVIGGVDEDDADRMARFATQHRIPVVLARPPRPGGASPYVFVAGDEPAEVARALVGALVTRGAKPVVVVAEPSTPI